VVAGIEKIEKLNNEELLELIKQKVAKNIIFEAGFPLIL